MNSDLCFKNITISFNGISVGATIQDTVSFPQTQIRYYHIAYELNLLSVSIMSAGRIGFIRRIVLHFPSAK